MLVKIAAIVALCFSTCCLATADSSTGDRKTAITSLLNRQDKVRSFPNVALSPDGSRLAWSVTGPDLGTEEIYVAPRSKPLAAERITAVRSHDQPCRDTNPVWSRRGNQLAFLSDCASPNQLQLFVVDLQSEHFEPRQLTHLSGFLSHPQWSPRDDEIAFLFVQSATRTPSPMAAEDRAVGVIDDLQNTSVQRLAVTNLHTAAMRAVTADDLYIFEYDWSPDGQSFAFTAAAPPGDDNWYIAQLYVQSIDMQRRSVIYRPPFQMALPRWSPDGKYIAFIQGLMSDEGGTGGEICMVRSTGGALRDLTPGRKSSPAWFSWVTDREILFTEFSGGSTSIGRLDLPDAVARILWQVPETIHASSTESSLSFSNANSRFDVALVRTSWAMLPEVWAGPVAQPSQITHVNAPIDLPLPKSENITWASDGFQVQGWLLYPDNYDSGKRYPMLVAVHGGPAWITTPSWRSPDFDTTLFTNFGYFVFFPNARGSYGHGEAFTRANRRDWGFGDLQDMLRGVDAVVTRHPVETTRIGILGWSYGGSTAMMAITQTNRFRAAVAGAGAGDWKSYYGQNAIDKWMISYFGASVYDDPKAYERCSALTYIKNAKTPTLILVGERDGEAPPAQSIQFWHALKELRVPAKLVIYADEGHSFNKQEDRIDVTLRTLNWFDEYMPKK